MKTNFKKEGRAWIWEVVENGEVIAAGNCKTKTAAENDASIWIETTEACRAKNAGRIAKGDEVKIKPEWQDKGDENYTFFAIETQLEGMKEVRVRAVNNATGEPSIGTQSVQIRMIEGN